MYCRYVDDTVIVLQSINKGWYYSTLTKRMVFDKDLEDNDTRSSSERTTDIMATIANEIQIYNGQT